MYAPNAHFCIKTNFNKSNLDFGYVLQTNILFQDVFMNNVGYFRWTKTYLVIRTKQDNLYNCQWLQIWSSILSSEHHLLGDVLTPGLPLGSYTIFETLRIINRLGAILACEGVDGQGG